MIISGPRQQKRFKRLMLNRLKWNEEKTSEEGSSIGSSMLRHCELVWEGSTKKRHFGQLKFKVRQAQKNISGFSLCFMVN